MSRNEKTEFFTAFEVARHSGVPFLVRLFLSGVVTLVLLHVYCSNVRRSAIRLMGRRHGLVQTLKYRIELATFSGESQRLHPLDAHLGNIGLRFQNLHHLC